MNLYILHSACHNHFNFKTYLNTRYWVMYRSWIYSIAVTYPSEGMHHGHLTEDTSSSS